MKATINDETYDAEEADEICSAPSPDGDDCLYRTEDGRFFLVEGETWVDGVKLAPSQEIEDVAPELNNIDLDESAAVNRSKSHERRKRAKTIRKIIPLTERQALVWCVKTQMPDCFRGYVLESI